jgi:hypothetical protein
LDHGWPDITDVCNQRYYSSGPTTCHAINSLILHHVGEFTPTCEKRKTYRRFLGMISSEGFSQCLSLKRNGLQRTESQTTEKMQKKVIFLEAKRAKIWQKG